MTSVPTARIAGATLCHIPPSTRHSSRSATCPMSTPCRGEDLAIESRAQRRRCGGREDGGRPGLAHHPADTDRLRDYWTHGKGAAKIGWGTPGTSTRCRASLAKYVKPMCLSGYCANRHYDALGFWPGDRSKHSLGVTASGEPDGPFITLVADAPSAPTGLVHRPAPDRPSPIVVTEDGASSAISPHGAPATSASATCASPRRRRRPTTRSSAPARSSPLRAGPCRADHDGNRSPTSG